MHPYLVAETIDRILALGGIVEIDPDTGLLWINR